VAIKNGQSSYHKTENEENQNKKIKKRTTHHTPRCKKHEFQHSHADTQTYTNKSKLNENA
jgi:hypothetical protein